MTPSVLTLHPVYTAASTNHLLNSDLKREEKNLRTVQTENVYELINVYLHFYTLTVTTHATHVHTLAKQMHTHIQTYWW